MSNYTKDARGLLFDATTGKLVGIHSNDGTEHLLEDFAAFSTAPHEDGVIIGGSTEMRSHCIQSITAAQISVDGTLGRISFRTSNTYNLRAGHKVRVAALAYPEIEGTYQVISAVAEAPGTRVIAQITQGLTLTTRALGYFSGNSIDMHDMQVRSVAAGWPSMLEGVLGGRIRCIVNATGGSGIADWLDPLRVRQVAAHARDAGGKLGFLIVGPGMIGNSINSANNARSGDQALIELAALLKTYAPMARFIYVGEPPAATNQNLTANTTNIAANTAKLATAVRIMSGLDFVIRRTPNARRVPIAGAEVVNYGSSSTTDVTNGFAPIKAKADDGIHNLWPACQVWAAAFGLVMQNDFPPRYLSNGVAPASVIATSVADNGGSKYVPNMAEGFYGTVAATGNIPNSCSTASNSLPSGSSLTQALVVNFDAGQDWTTSWAYGGTNASAASVANQIYTGTSNSLLTELNRSRNQGVDIDMFGGFGVFGFLDGCGGLVELCLEVDTGDGLGYVQISSVFSANGQFQMSSMTYTDSSKPGMTWGYNFKAVRFPRFQIPAGTVLTGARIRHSFKPKNGTNWGTAVMRFGANLSIYANT